MEGSNIPDPVICYMAQWLNSTKHSLWDSLGQASCWVPWRLWRWLRPAYLFFTEENSKNSGPQIRPRYALGTRGMWHDAPAKSLANGSSHSVPWVPPLGLERGKWPLVCLSFLSLARGTLPSSTMRQKLHYWPRASSSPKHTGQREDGHERSGPCCLPNLGSPCAWTGPV